MSFVQFGTELPGYCVPPSPPRLAELLSFASGKEWSETVQHSDVTCQGSGMVRVECVKTGEMQIHQLF